MAEWGEDKRPWLRLVCSKSSSKDCINPHKLYLQTRFRASIRWWRTSVKSKSQFCQWWVESWVSFAVVFSNLYSLKPSDSHPPWPACSSGTWMAWNLDLTLLLCGSQGCRKQYLISAALLCRWSLLLRASLAGTLNPVAICAGCSLQIAFLYAVTHFLLSAVAVFRKPRVSV